MVTVHVRMLFKPEVSGLPKIHQTLGADYDERVLPSIANEASKKYFKSSEKTNFEITSMCLCSVFVYWVGFGPS